MRACWTEKRSRPNSETILGLNREDFGGLRVGCTHKPPERHGDLPALRLAVAGSNEPIGVDDEPAGMQLAEGGERGVDFRFGASVLDSKLYPLRMRRFLCVSDDAFGIRVVGVDQQSDHAGLGNPRLLVKASRGNSRSNGRRPSELSLPDSR
jgi:hypothetical protein